MAEITITIGPDGTTEVAVQGVAGPGCRDLTARIEAALGVAGERRLTTEYYEAHEEKAQEQGHQ